MSSRHISFPDTTRSSSISKSDSTFLALQSYPAAHLSHQVSRQQPCPRGGPSPDCPGGLPPPASAQSRSTGHSRNQPPPMAGSPSLGSPEPRGPGPPPPNSGGHTVTAESLDFYPKARALLTFQKCSQSAFVVTNTPSPNGAD